MQSHSSVDLTFSKMGSLVQKKKRVVPALVPNESFAKNNQHLTLDGAVSSSWRSNQIKSSAEAQFEERSIQLREGSYPLHMAIANGAPKAVIEMLIKAAPDVLSFTDKYDRTCLHLAVAGGSTTESFEEVHCGQEVVRSLEILELLSSVDTKQVMRQDKANNLPLHTAIQGGCSVSCVEFLIRTYPQAVNVKNKDGMTPLDVALKFGNCSKDVLSLLQSAKKA
jgi:hypothetical protein